VACAAKSNSSERGHAMKKFPTFSAIGLVVTNRLSILNERPLNTAEMIAAQ
jgi:hypothetical protein